ncbi:MULTISPECIES: NAD-dependent epimerase/dehydratase family protein [Olivibacter]|jgi:nucleoside-diphosphate-sugar epimerase|uniref:NAD-dependent epimerase/dehydratase family protein n=1 Tax=Olivibacter oleidegradans TaxID=760123 RepID=A0ABV6HI76_9SPHI|nr:MULTISPECIES: NAD(P)-dependent oxidoreductase [Olivibacter]
MMMQNLELLEQKLYEPSASLIADMSQIDGDIMILGAGGKMGPSMAKAAHVASKLAGKDRRVIAVSRFSDGESRDLLQASGVETITADLLNEDHLQSLPDVEHIIYLVGQKFGTTGKEPFTWIMNTYLPGRIAERFKNSRMVIFSTGNVYPLSLVTAGGCSEEQSPEPIGEYGQSCLGRERIFQFFAEKYQIPTLIYRLNYAIDLRYGVLLEIAKAVMEDKPIDLRMGNVNVIWQGDANEIALRSLLHCTVPAKILNVTGPETVSIQWLANQFGNLLNKTPRFINETQPTALLSNASAAHQLFGYPKVTLRQMIEITANWLNHGGKTIEKPTHFQERQGRF